MRMPLMLTMRGRRSANTVPDTERVCLSVTTDTVMRLSKSPAISRVVSSTTIPRSLATTGADTTFTSCSIGRSRPATAGEEGAGARGWRLGVHPRHRALVGNLPLSQAGLDQRFPKGAEFLRERDVRT